MLTYKNSNPILRFKIYKMNIEIISGSPRTASVTNRLAIFLEKELKEKSNHNIGLIDVRNWNLGLLNNVFSSVEKTPEEFKPLAERMFAADAFVIVTPEYNGSYSPALQNLLDHFPKQSRKAFAIATASTGGLGGARSSQQTLLLVPALFGIASPYLLITPFIDKKFNQEGDLVDETFRPAVNTFVNEFLWLAESLQGNK